MEADFLIPALPPGKYAFAMVTVGGSETTSPGTAIGATATIPAAGGTAPASASTETIAPWRLSFLMRQEQTRWLLAGFFPKPLTAAGHDGLWYWTHARQFAKEGQAWNAWLYYKTAMMLLQPADFVVSTHLDKLKTETSAAAPPPLSQGVSPDAPLVVKGPKGEDYYFTSLGVDDSMGPGALDVAARVRAESTSDPAAARQYNTDAMSALLSAYPEIRKPFHGIVIEADAPGQNPVVTELPMAEIK